MDIVVESREGLLQEVTIGAFRLLSDEPMGEGGGGLGPSPYGLLCAALGACTSMTLRMYARTKGWPLQGVKVRLRHDRIHARDCAECETKEGRLDRIERDISLSGPLDDAQRKRLLEIADKCPVHRTLTREVHIVTRLMAP